MSGSAAAVGEMTFLVIDYYRHLEVMC